MKVAEGLCPSRAQSARKLNLPAPQPTQTPPRKIIILSKCAPFDTDCSDDYDPVCAESKSLDKPKTFLNRCLLDVENCTQNEHSELKFDI
jgi:hypothetical protein